MVKTGKSNGVGHAASGGELATEGAASGGVSDPKSLVNALYAEITKFVSLPRCERGKKDIATLTGLARIAEATVTVDGHANSKCDGE